MTSLISSMLLLIVVVGLLFPDISFAAVNNKLHGISSHNHNGIGAVPRQGTTFIDEDILSETEPHNEQRLLPENIGHVITAQETPLHRFRRSATGNWWYAGNTFPHPRHDLAKCNRSGVTDNMICNPDGVITVEQANTLQRIIEDTVKKTSCQCTSCSGIMGHFAIGVALPLYIIGPDMEREDSVRHFTSNLGTTYWADLGKCDDHVVIGYSKKQQVHYTVVGSKAAERVTPECIQTASDLVENLVAQGQVFPALQELVKAYSSALSGGGCSGSGLTSGQVAGAVIGTLLGVFLVLYILVCIGYCCGADCILGTMFGQCARSGLLAVQGVINCCCVDCIGGLFKGCCERSCPSCVCRQVQCVWEEDEQPFGAGNPTGIVGFDPSIVPDPPI